MGLFDNISVGIGNYYGNSYGFCPSASYGYSFGEYIPYFPLFNFNTNNYFSLGNSSYNAYDFSFATSSSYVGSGETKFGSLTSARKQSTPRTQYQSGLGRGSRGKYCGKGSEYGSMSKNSALQKASNDSRLEFIGNGGKGWSISDASFRNDIKYATSGTSSVLDGVVAEIRKTDPNFSLLVTSALGTASSPHSKNAGHYNVESVKLDFGGGMSKAQATKVASQLRETGKFDFADPECDGATWHIDAQIKKEFLA